MKDLRRALQRRSERSTPIGSERLRQRVAFELAGGHMRPENTRRRIPGLILASVAALIVLIGIGSVLLLGGEDESVVVTTDATTPPTVTTQAPLPSIEWSEASLPSGIWLTSVLEADPGLVAIGCVLEATEQTNYRGDRFWDFHDHAAIWSSDDGRTWNERLIDDDIVTDAGCIVDVAETSTGLVAVGTTRAVDGVVWLSSDGITWQRVDPAAMQGDDAVVVNAIELGVDGTLVASGWGGLEALVWTSEDGRDWTLVDDEDLGIRSWVDDLAASPNGFLMVGADRSSEFFTKPGVWHSVDGSEWDRIPMERFDVGSNPLSAVEAIAQVQATADASWRIGDVAGRIWISDDATNWELAYDPDAGDGVVPGVEWIHSRGNLVTVGLNDLDNGIKISIDEGQTWFEDTRNGIPPEIHIDAIFGFGDGFIAIGSENPPFTTPDPDDTSSTRLWVGTWDN